MIGGMATTSAARQLTAILRSGAGPLARALVENGGAMRVSDVAALLERDRTDKALRAAIERVVRRALTWCCPAHGVAIDQPNVPYDDPRAAPLPV
jgi:hypothetical protein